MGWNRTKANQEEDFQLLRKGVQDSLWEFILYCRRRVRARDPSCVRTRRLTRAC